MNKPIRIVNEETCSVEYRLNGKLHRTDGPAEEGDDGTKIWYVNGRLHRTDGPAVEHPDGYKAWYINGRLHRTDGPAVEQPSGIKYWHVNGESITVRNHKKFVNDYPGLVNQFLAHQILDE